MRTDPADDDLDSRLRSWGEQARCADAGTTGLPTLPGGRRRSPGRWVIAAAAAVAAAVVIPVVAVRSGPAAPATSPSPSTAAPTSGSPTSSAPAGVSAGVPAAVITAMKILVGPNQAVQQQVSMFFVRASTKRAEAFVDGSGTDGRPDRQMWVAVALGDFVGYATKRPSSAAPPTGTAIVALIADDGQISSWSLGSWPDLDPGIAGPVITIPAAPVPMLTG